MKTLFGPVPSRRLGRSLGIDVIKPKTCTFDCVYCESGLTTHLTLQRRNFYSIQDVLRDLEEYFEAHPGGADVLTFSSAGEPTLYGDLGELIQRIKQRFPSFPVVVLTNGSLLWDPQARKGLMDADRVVPSLDAVSEHVFRKLNRPHPQLQMTRILEGLKRFRQEYRGNLHMEILLVKGFNDQEEELRELARVAGDLQPDRIELNTVVRPPAYEGIVGLNEEEMERAAAYFPQSITEIIGKFTGPCSTARKERELAARVEELLLRRPCTSQEMARSLAVADDALETALTDLCSRGRLKRYIFNDNEYFCPTG